MALSPEDMQALIDKSRAQLGEEKKRENDQIANLQANPPVSEEEALADKPEKSMLEVLATAGKTVADSGIQNISTGIADLSIEFGTGLWGAFAGTAVGTGRELLDNDKMSKHGEFFMDTFQHATEAFTYQPRSKAGHALSGLAQDFMGQFEEWGDQFGDFIFDETGSAEWATAAKTAVTGAPIYAPIVGGAVTSFRPAKTKLTRRKEVKDDTIIDAETTKTVNDISQDTVAGVKGMQKLIDEVVPDTQAIENKRLQTKMDKQLRELEKQERDPSQKTLDLEDFPAVEGKPATPHPDVGTRVKDVEMNMRARRVNEIQDASIKASGKKVWPTWKQVGDKLNETTFDATAGLRRRILNGLDKNANRQLELMHNKQAGATPKAQLDYQRSESAIYQGLNEPKSINLDKMINSLRTIQIDKNAKVKKKLPPKHSGNLSAVDHIAKLEDMKRELGVIEYAKLRSRADKYFETTNNLLKDIYAEGLISKKQYDSMVGDIYEPRKFLERFDPANESLSTGVLAFDIRGKRVKMNDSGLQELGKGSIELMELDSKALLQEYTVRSVNRIWRNQANVQLLDWVKDNPNNGWVRVAKKGEKIGEKGSIDAYIDGKKITMLMEKKFALQWVGNTYVMGHGFSNFMRIGSGQFIMKPLTTGMNPEFALKLFAVDVMHAFFATDVFSKSAPVYTLQLGKNLGVTMKDAFFKGQRFKDFINEGGGMNFLTHQGTDVFGGKGIIRNNTGWRRAKTYLSFMNEGFEVWVRLAIRERAIKTLNERAKTESRAENALTIEQEATLIAREYIDFSQGGTIAKALDTGLPYFNSVLQATRTLARGAKRNPGRFAYQTAELSVLAASWAMYQELRFPEVMQDISAEDKAKFWIIPTGRSIRNQQGEVQHLVVKLRKDNVVAALINPAEMAIRNYVTGEVPDDQTLAYFKSASPVIPMELSTPMGAAIHTFAYNHDFWGNPVWNDPDLDVDLAPEEEFEVASMRGEASSPFFRDVGKALGLSPTLLQSAVENVAPSNGYLDAGGWAYKKIVEEMIRENPQDAFLAQDVTEQVLNDFPFARKLTTLTHPAHRVIEEAKRPRTQSQVARKQQRDKMDLMLVQGTNEETIQQWIRQQKPEDQGRLFNSMFAKKELTKIFNGKQDMSLNVPGPFFWNHVASEIKEPEQKAEVLYWEWRKMPTPQDRAQFMSIANRLSVNQQIWPSTTMKHFRVMQERWGSEGIMTELDGGEYKRFGKRHYMDEMVFDSTPQRVTPIRQNLLPNVP